MFSDEGCELASVAAATTTTTTINTTTINTIATSWQQPVTSVSSRLVSSNRNTVN